MNLTLCGTEAFWTRADSDAGSKGDASAVAVCPAATSPCAREAAPLTTEAIINDIGKRYVNVRGDIQLVMRL